MVLTLAVIAPRNVVDRRRPSARRGSDQLDPDLLMGVNANELPCVSNRRSTTKSSLLVYQRIMVSRLAGVRLRPMGSGETVSAMRCHQMNCRH